MHPFQFVNPVTLKVYIKRLGQEKSKALQELIRLMRNLKIQPLNYELIFKVLMNQ